MVITGRRTELLDKLKSKNNNAYFTETFDITNTKLIDEILNSLTTELGGLRGSGIGPGYNTTKAYQINYLEGLK